MDPIIQIVNLRKSFRVPTQQGFWRGLVDPGREHVAVDDISLDLQAGEFVGFLGPNGAGKSTTIKMLTGILTPTSGALSVCGLTPWRQRQLHARNIGVVFGQRTQLWWDLPPLDSFALLAKIYRIPTKQYQENLELFTDILALGDLGHTPVRKLSLGQKMRCELAAALLHNPRILFLDEPTIGLDLFAKEAIRTFLKDINRSRGTTILLTTHDLDDVEDLCRRVVIIDQGAIVNDCPLSYLKRAFGNEKTIAFEVDPDDSALKLPAGAYEVRRDHNVRYVAFSQVSTSDVVGFVLRHHQVRDISFQSPDITQVIKKAYGHHLL